jgi:WD40 repeat protein
MSTALPVAQSAVDADNPWPGLASFTEEARMFFFGREKETEELVRLIRRNTLTVLFGQSGLGKSSLLQAGAFPVLREADFLPLYLRLDHGAEAPALADQVKSALVDAFKSVGADAPAPRADETLWEYFHRKDIDIWSPKNRLLTPVLAFDQFEEIFTLGRASDAARERGRAFLVELADLVENRAPVALRAKFDAGELETARYNFDKPSCQVVLSLREDFLPDLEGLKHEMRSILHSRMRVKRLNGTQALEIVARPAPHLLADGVAERVVEFVAGARGGSVERLAELEVEPALLSVICRELNERRRALGQPQITADLVSGNRREILTHFYERSVADLPEGMRAFVEDRLLTKSGFRDNLALETAVEEPGVTRPLIDTLVSRRLLRIEDRLGVQRVELTHDVLAEVIRGSRDARQQRLALERERQRERVTRRRMWLARTIAAGLLIGLTGVSWIAWRAVRAEREQGRLRTNEVALRELAEKQERAARRMAYASDMNGVQHALAVENLGRARELLYRHLPKDGESDLRGWEWRYLWQFCQSDAVGALIRPDEAASVISLSASADGRWLAVGGAYDGTLSLLNLETNDRSRVPAGSGRVFVAFSPSASLLAMAIEETASGGGALGFSRSPSRVVLWDVIAKKAVWETPLTASCVGMSFSADGQTLAVTDFGAGESAIVLYRASDGVKKVGWPVRGYPFNFIFSKFTTTPDLSLAAFEVLSGNTASVTVVDLKSGQERKRFDLGTAGALALSPDGKILAWSPSAMTESAAIRLVDVQSGELLGQLDGHQSRPAQLIFSSDGKRLISASADQTLRLWDVTTRSALRKFNGHQTEVWRVALLPDERTIISGCKDGSVYRWDLETTRDTLATGTVPLPGAPWGFAENGRSLVTVTLSGRVIKRGGPGYREASNIMDIGPITAAVFDRGRSRLAAKSATGKVQVWDWQRQALVREFNLPEGTRAAPQQFSTDGSKLIVRLSPTRDNLSHREWDIETGQETRSFDFELAPTSRASEAYSRDGKHYIAVSYPSGSAQLVDLVSGRSKTLEADMREPGALPAFSEDGQLLAVPSLRSHMRVYDLRAERPVAKLGGYMFGVHSSTFSPDGRRIVSGGSAFEAVMIWDAESHERVLTLPAGTNVLSPIAFSADGNVLVGRHQARATFWRAPTWEEIEGAEKEARNRERVQ